MSYRIESIECFVRETAPARFASALGRKGRAGEAETAQRVTSPLCHVRLVLRDDQGNETFGCAADRLSVRWLDKRPGRSKPRKLHELVGLIEFAADQYRQTPRFEKPFPYWLRQHRAIMAEGERRDQEALTSTFASALFERALLDGVSRLADRPLVLMLRDERLGFEPGAIHPHLKDASLAPLLQRGVRTQIAVRHTIGLLDPLTAADQGQPVGDGLPETVEQYIERQGIHFFKIKISGDTRADLERLWDLLPADIQPTLTLDANEAFEDPQLFARFVEQLERQNLGLFQHILLIEQPLPRRLTFSADARRWIARVAERKPVIIDEADATLDAFPRALAAGYTGTSHKNCKGVFKSLASSVLVFQQAAEGRPLVMSAEDLQNLPVVPLQQDLTTVGILGIDHCERNGHHYNYGLSMLTDGEKEAIARYHPDLYEEHDGEWFLRIRKGRLNCLSLQTAPGFGVVTEPDWASMQPMRTWLAQRYPDSR